MHNWRMYGRSEIGFRFGPRFALTCIAVIAVELPVALSLSLSLALA